MKKILLSTVFSLVSMVSANEIQIFTTNTMHIALDKETKFVNIYNGTLANFYENSSKILNSKEVLSVGVNGAYKGALNTDFSANGQVNSDFASAGAIGALAGYALGSGVKWVISDNEYLSISKAINTKGEATLLQTLIVANYSISDNDIKTTGENARLKLIK